VIVALIDRYESFMEILNLRSWTAGPLLENAVASTIMRRYQPPQNLERLTQLSIHISLKSRFLV
jgi:hypothetical protein